MKTDFRLFALGLLVAVTFLVLGTGVVGVLTGNPLFERRPTMVSPVIVVTPDAPPLSHQVLCAVPPECAG